VTRLRGYFNGQTVVLDDPVPPELTPGTLVEIVLLPDTPLVVVNTKGHEELAHEWEAAVTTLWNQTASDVKPTGRKWKREDLYERGGKPLGSREK